MLNQIYRVFCRGATVVNLLLLGLASALLTGGVLPWAVSKLQAFCGAVGPIELLFFYSPAEVYPLLKACGAQGRSFYTAVQLTAGLVCPLVYALLLSGLIVYFYRLLLVRPETIKVLFLIPVVALLTHYAENACLIMMLIHYPYRLEGMATAASLLMGLKWLLGIGSLWVVLWGGLALGGGGIRMRGRAGKGQVRPRG